MRTNTQHSPLERGSAGLGSAPADLHVSHHGERMSHDQDGGLADTLRSTLANVDQQRLATALGWFSVALGMAEVLAPRQLGRAIGVDSNPNLLRAMGLREIASGVGILAAKEQRAGWLWSRVAGDAIDLALLGAAMTADGSNRARVSAATAAVAGVTALDIYCSQQMSRNGSAGPVDQAASGTVREMVTVDASAEDCYRAWRDFPRLSRFMDNVESVRETGAGRWHWVVKAPGGGTVEWDARVTADEPGRRLAWESLAGADVDNRGSVVFDSAPGGRGTVVRVEMSYVPPAGPVGAVAAKVTGQSPEHKVREDLRRFKQLMETGEIPTTSGQPAGKRGIVYNLFKRERSA